VTAVPASRAAGPMSPLNSTVAGAVALSVPLWSAALPSVSAKRIAATVPASATAAGASATACGLPK
jgi:hypothetical protein